MQSLITALKVGIIGGGRLPAQWGLPCRALEVETPHGKPSASVLETPLGPQTVYSILRHGEKHSEGYAVNYLANVAALHQLGCEIVMSLSLAGSLSERFDVGSMVLYDDIIDFRKTSASFHLDSSGVYCSMAPLVDEALRGQLELIGPALGVTVGATMVVIEGPRFSTRAESRMYSAFGAELICQTAAPECFLVREKGMGWCGFCLVTDRDTRDPGAMVTTELIFKNMREHEHRFAQTVLQVVRHLASYDRPKQAGRDQVPHNTFA